MRVTGFASAALLALSVALGATGEASAATCSLGAEGKVLQNPGDVAAACDAGSDDNDNPLPGQVNFDLLHGFGDWQYAGKFDFDTDSFEAGSVNAGFTVSKGLQSGTFDFADNLFSLFANAMIVIKGASGNNTQENYVGYLLSSLLSPDGTYATPFFNDNNGNAKNISHISAYVRGTPDTVNEVPLPAAAWMLIAALGGLGLLRRRAA